MITPKNNIRQTGVFRFLFVHNFHKINWRFCPFIIVNFDHSCMLSCSLYYDCVIFLYHP